MGSDQAPYRDYDAVSGDGTNSHRVQGSYHYWRDNSQTNYNTWNYNDGGSYIYHEVKYAKKYEDDTILISTNYQGFMYMKNITTTYTDSNVRWTPIYESTPSEGTSNTNHKLDWVDVGGVRYNVFASGHSSTGFIKVITGKVYDENCTST